MARIDGIRVRLENWARWAARGDSGGLGYPRINMLARMGGIGSGWGSVMPIDVNDASETDDAIKSLHAKQPHLYLVITLHYGQSLTITKVAGRLCKAESTIKRNLEDADHALQAWLVDKADARRNQRAR